MSRKNNITLENATMIYRNFSGKPTKVNPDGGKRSFTVLIDNERAEELKKEGWWIKYLKPRTPSEEPQACMQVNVSIPGNASDPKVIMIGNASHKITELDENTIDKLDKVDIVRIDDTHMRADMIIRPYEYEPGKVSAYLKSLYVHVVEDELEIKYAEYIEKIEKAGV